MFGGASVNEASHESLCARSRKIFIFDNVVGMVIGVICGGSYLAGLLAAINVPTYLNGLISSIGLMGGVFQIFGAALLQGKKRKKSFLVFWLCFLRISFSAIFVIPFVFGVSKITVLTVVVLYSLGNFAGAATNPGLINWMGGVTPEGERSGFFAVKERYSLIGAAVTALAASYVLDKLFSGANRLAAFAVLGSGLLVLAVIDSVILLKLYEPPFKKTGLQKAGLRGIISPLFDKSFSVVLVLSVIWQLATSLSGPVMGVFYIDIVGMGYTIIGVMNIAGTIIKALFVTVWAKTADKKGWEATLRYTFAIVAVSQLAQIFMSADNYVVIYPLSAIISNIGYSGIGIALLNVQFNYAKSEDKTNYIALCAAISGLTGFAGAMFGSFLMKLMSDMNYTSFFAVRILLTASSIGILATCMYIKVKMKNKNKA